MTDRGWYEVGVFNPGHRRLLAASVPGVLSYLGARRLAAPEPTLVLIG